jgi:hypothetical protein
VLERSRELILALLAILFITVAYFFIMALTRELPAASGLYGHSMGVLGLILMLMTETLYSLRKRLRLARWGRMSGWLEFHIFTGLVGPYLVLLHTSWKFNGLAGVVMLLTGVIVISGFIGRYIYTSVPHTSDGLELNLVEIENRIAVLEAQMTITRPTGAPPTRAIPQRLNDLARQRDRLRRQAARLISARRLLSLWHAVHIPIGLALFILAFVHAGAAIYYATLLR